MFPTIHCLHCSFQRSFLPHNSTNIYKTLVTYQILHCITVLHAPTTTNTATQNQLIEWLPIKTRELYYPHPLPLSLTPSAPLSVSLACRRDVCKLRLQQSQQSLRDYEAPFVAQLKRICFCTGRYTSLELCTKGQGMSEPILTDSIMGRSCWKCNSPHFVKQHN